MRERSCNQTSSGSAVSTPGLWRARALGPQCNSSVALSGDALDRRGLCKPPDVALAGLTLVLVGIIRQPLGQLSLAD